LCVGDISELRLISFPRASSIVEEPSPDIEEICPISDEPEATVWNGNPKTFEWVQDDFTECNVPPRIWELPMPTLKKPKVSCCFCFINALAHSKEFVSFPVLKQSVFSSFSKIN
jgi:hypothetical protein